MKKCPKNRNDCKCIDKIVFINNKWFCIGEVFPPHKVKQDVIRLCDENTKKNIIDITPDEANALILLLSESIGNFFNKFQPYRDWRLNKEKIDDK